MSASTATELSRLVRSLQQERQQHVDALAEIDATFASLGLSPAPAKRRGRKPGVAAASAAGAKPKGKGKRRRHKAKDGKTGEQFLVDLLKGEKLLTAEVNARWEASGRNGRANILLGKLVKEGKLARKEIKDARGSQYSAA